jgi:citrate lyase beta subunit
MPVNPIALGASLYVPAIRQDLVEIANGEKIPGLRSVIFCTEDSIHEEQLAEALSNIAFALPQMASNGLQTVPLRFVRPRTPRVLEQLLSMPGNFALDGFVLPKITSHNISDYLGLFGERTPFCLMVTLETKEVVMGSELERLRDLLLDSKAQVLSLRVGGNDLLSTLSLRRERGVTAYETPLGFWIHRIVTAFKPYGINVAAPVYDYTSDEATLWRETKLDVQNGLFGKTAIHPSQIPIIEGVYRVSLSDVEKAEAVLSPTAKAVFRMGDAMLEPATHRNWANAIVERARIYGVMPEVTESARGEVLLAATVA